MLEMAIFFPDDVSTWNFPTSTSYIYSPLPAIALGHDVRPFPSSFFRFSGGMAADGDGDEGERKFFAFPPLLSRGMKRGQVDEEDWMEGGGPTRANLHSISPHGTVPCN